MLRSLRSLDPSITLGWVRDAIGIRDDEEVIRARNATLRERPADVKKFFLSQLQPIVAAQAARASARGGDPLGAGRRPVRILSLRMFPRRVRIGASVGLFAVVSVHGACAQELLLQIRPQAGDTLRMRLDQETEMTPA